MSYTYIPYFQKPPKIDEIFSVGQQTLKTKIANFYIQRNIQLEVANSNKSNFVMECKNPINAANLRIKPIRGIYILFA
jgi:hypothetical protein